MATIADLKARIALEGADQTQKALARIKGGSGNGGNGILDVASSFKSGLGAVTGFLTGFAGFSIATDALGLVKSGIEDVITAGLDQQKIEAQTAAVIKSTGGAAGFSTEQIGNMADSLAQLTGISNDTIQSSSNVLLTFRAIGHDIFPQAQKSILDVATAMHEDLQSATVQVGKALNDPITGMTALQRIGVTFTQGQKDAAKQMELTGNMAGAQSIVIAELTKEFGGSAVAAGQTLPGKLAILNEKFDEAKEKIAGAVIPVISELTDKYVMPLADWLGKFLPGAIQVTTNFLDNELVPAISAVMNSPFVVTIEGWAEALATKLDPQLVNNTPGASDKTVKAFKKVSDQALGTGDTLAGPFVARVQTSIGKLDNLTDALNGGKTNTQNIGVSPAILKVNKNLADMDAALDANAAHINNDKNQIPAWVAALGGAAGSLGQFNQDLYGVMTKLGQLKDSVVSNFGGASAAQTGILGGMSFNLKNWGFNAEKLWNGTWQALSGITQAGIDTVKQVFAGGLDFLHALTSHDWDKVRADWANTEKQIVHDVQQFVNGVNKAVSGLPSWLQGVGGVPGLPFGIGGAKVSNARASGGSISGPFIGAERGPELLMTPGVYNAPPGSYVYNAQQTQQLLSGGSQQRPIIINVNGADHNSTMALAQEVMRQIKRQELLNGRMVG